MIKKVDISKFGVINNYSWDSCIGSTEGFRKLNIIYGRNYVGKTTISRIFRCIENKMLHNQYCDANFTLTFYDGNVITHNNLPELDIPYHIRVYNSDFVRENLSWLHNDDGTIKPFTILGAKNVEIDRQIKALEEELGDEKDAKGLISELNERIKTYENKKRQYDENLNDLNNKLRAKAVEIKNEASIYNFPTYQINSIKKDIGLEPSILNQNQIDEYRKLLKEEAKKSIGTIKAAKPTFSKYYELTTELLSKEIKPSKSITDLINNHILQEWVRQGMEMHKSIRNTCGFCGNTLPEDIWLKLDSHFNKESEDLRKQVQDQIENLILAKQNFENFELPPRENFYNSLLDKYLEINEEWISLSKKHTTNLSLLMEKLKQKEKDIFTTFKLEEIEDVSDDILELINKLNELILNNDSQTDSLSTDQDYARNQLRLSEVAKFIKDIDYYKSTQEIDFLDEEVKDLDLQKNNIKEKVGLLLEQKRQLEAQAKDESKGAELVNQHLSHFFGHQELKLVADGENSNISFKIIRNEHNATNLSEGECSLISFCYFIARLEDELNDSLNNDKLIIYIDDPISSLDNNHIFFMFSLIEAIIAKPKKYCQLFISTHNLDFLKYLRKLTIPNKYKFSPNGKDISGLANFVMERKNKTISQLSIAPIYLRNYITEFNYLFNQIYKCSISDIETITHDYHYNFGNNMRKFLEAYLFYKYPSHNLSFEKRLNNFFKNDQVSITLINRVINEYSHLGDNFERGLEPIDSDSISLISKAVLEKIKENDPEQYAALLDSINDVEIVLN